MSDVFDSIRIAPRAQQVRRTRQACYMKQRQGSRGHTPAQDEVVVFVTQKLKETGAPPTIAEVQHHMGWKHKHSAIDVLRKVAGRLPAKAKSMVQW